MAFVTKIPQIGFEGSLQITHLLNLIIKLGEINCSCDHPFGQCPGGSVESVELSLQFFYFVFALQFVDFIRQTSHIIRVFIGCLDNIQLTGTDCRVQGFGGTIQQHDHVVGFFQNGVILIPNRFKTHPGFSIDGEIV